MIPELGLFALITALIIAIVQSVLPLIGAARNQHNLIAIARPAAFAQALFLMISYGCLTYAFISNDFSTSYVAQNSNSALPLLYRISGVWGAHEGSLLLWVLTLGGWGAAVAAYNRNIPDVFLARVLAVMGMIGVGFMLFVLFTSNPFERLPFPPAEGRDLNPLLQDPGLAIHPPMLYFGYVGFAVAFAFAIAALMGKDINNNWARWARPWTNIAWMFLTFGIALGSWWAYYELGWGGWWFWDPVENASFQPWLVGTALIHSLAATDKRNAFKAWTVLLAIFAFSLSLLGTFLVRSGVLTSVHAFATDPERGIFILGFLLFVVGGSLTLYAIRAPAIRSKTKFALFSREFALLMNNVFLVVVACAVLLGTLYPLIIDALGQGKLSVGPPYFNVVFILLTAPLALLVGIGASTRWKRDEPKRVLMPLIAPAILSLIGAFVWLQWGIGEFKLAAFAGASLALWVVFTTLMTFVERGRGRNNKLYHMFVAPRGFYGMVMAHLGIAVFIIGITFTSLYSTERDVGLAPGETLSLAGYDFVFNGVKDSQGPNYEASRGSIDVYQNDRLVTSLNPEKRTYQSQRAMPMTEADIDVTLTRDIYVALGEPLDNGRWAVRIYHKSYIRWIWLGAVFMGLGGLWAATDRRYRVRQHQPHEALTLPKELLQS